jgi:hypothetical protein
MYDLAGYYLVADPIDRYSVGDRATGLRRDGDGSITIQHGQPRRHSNWLPAPAVPFHPVMRLISHRPPSSMARLRARPSRRAPGSRPSKRA